MPSSEPAGPALPLRDPHRGATETIAELGARRLDLYRAPANSDQERVEPVLTAGFYTMVPRVLDALRVPIENGPPERGSGS